LRRIGVPASKIVPWDWPPMATPAQRPAKTRTVDAGPVRFFYAGVISEDKGVGDCLGAVRILRERGRDARMSFAGSGEVAHFEARARELGIADAITFLGRIPHTDVVQRMHEHDLTVVPSRHSYPEGLPLTIYDSYCSRTPLVASDHPMFRGRVEDGVAALVFRGGSPESLAQRAEELLRSPELYERLSRNSEAAWQKLQLPVRWRDLLYHWIDDSPESREYFVRHSLASGSYSLPD
jgi:glycosyltransferase involved in cell wall biosynthesis